MKFTNAVATALGLGLTQASAIRPRAAQGNPITDPVRLAELQARHALVIEAQNPGTQLEKRVPMMNVALLPGFVGNRRAGTRFRTRETGLDERSP